MAQKIQSPGAFLQIMLKKYQMNANNLAAELNLSYALVRLITIDKAKITVPVAFRLSKLFNTVPEYWLSLQMKYDIAEAEKDKDLKKALKGISKISKSTAGKTARSETKAVKSPKSEAKAVKSAKGTVKTVKKAKSGAKTAPAKKTGRGRKAASAKT